MNYNTLATTEDIATTVAALRSKSIEPLVVTSGAEALATLKSLIPAGASVMNGASRTLEQIGFVDYLKAGTHSWNNLHAQIVNETDPAKQSVLRKQAVLSDYYVGSVHALAQNGEFVIGSNTGSQLPHIVFTSPHLIFVVSTKKIVPTLADALDRLESYVTPLEDQRIREAQGVGTALNKIVIFKNENPRLRRTVQLILVTDDLGF